MAGMEVLRISVPDIILVGKFEFLKVITGIQRTIL
jgi:hypothetical protein